MLSILRQRIPKHLLLQLVRAKSRLANTPRPELYFGYGANLSIDRFKSRKMNVEEIGNAILNDHEIRFTLANEYKGKGYAGVHPAANQKVYGVLYRMDQLSLKFLDTLEWAGYGAYERKLVDVVLEDGTHHQAQCYFVKTPFDHLKPSRIYLQNMIKAANERKFPQQYIDFLENHSYEESFEIDHGFSLLFYGKRRVLENELRPFYEFHDQWREKLCDLI